MNKESSEIVRNHLKALLTVCIENLPGTLLNSVDEILKEELKSLTIVDAYKLPRISSKYPIAVWRGDITTLKIDGIVNAANKYLLGCFTPNHPCIDNAIHCRAGFRLRVKCSELMRQQEFLEPTGKAKITPGYCLPSGYVLHTVGPTIEPGQPEKPDELASCYMECLNLSKQNNLRSIAFCCISTGIYGYPQEAAAHVALKTVKHWLHKNEGSMHLIVFNVFLEKDHSIYLDLAPKYFPSN